MSMYHTCPFCDSNLDHGEMCDCKESKVFRQAQNVTKEKQEPVNPLWPVLAPGA